MTQIKIEVPANDTIALNAFAEALQRIAAERTNATEYFDGTEQVIDDTQAKFVEPLNDGVTPPEAEFTAEQAVEHIGNANDNPMDTTPPETNYTLDDPTLSTKERIESLAQRLDINDTLDADGIPWDKRIHSKGKSRLADDTWRLRKRPADKDEDEWTTYIDTVKAELKAVQDIEAPTLDEQAVADVQESETVTPPTLDEQPSTELEGVTPNGDTVVVPDVEVGEPCPPVTPPSAVVPPVAVSETVTLNEGVAIDDIAEAATKALTEMGTTVTPPSAAVPPVAAVTPPASLTPPVADEPTVKTFPELMKYITTSAAKRGANNDMIKEVLLEVDASLTAIPLIANRVDLIPVFVEKLEARLV